MTISFSIDDRVIINAKGYENVTGVVIGHYLHLYVSYIIVLLDVPTITEKAVVVCPDSLTLIKKEYTIFKSFGGFEKDVFNQLFVKGPTWDGNICSKNGRDSIISRELAVHYEGWTQLTKLGLALAIDPLVIKEVKKWSDTRWYRKAINID
jgi:hypothetical protein